MPKENIYRDGRPDRAVTIGWSKSGPHTNWAFIKTNYPEVALGPAEISRLINVLTKIEKHMRQNALDS